MVTTRDTDGPALSTADDILWLCKKCYMTFDQVRAHRKPYADTMCVRTLYCDDLRWWTKIKAVKKGERL